MSVRRTKERLIQIITYCKFLLWHIELMFDDEAVEELMKYLDYEKLSVIFLVEMIRIGSIDKISMYIKLSMLYKKRMKFLKDCFIQNNVTALKSVCQTTTISTKNCSATESVKSSCGLNTWRTAVPTAMSCSCPYVRVLWQCCQNSRTR